MRAVIADPPSPSANVEYKEPTPRGDAEVLAAALTNLDDAGTSKGATA